MPDEDLLAKLFERLLSAEENKNGENDTRSDDRHSGENNGDDIFGGIDMESIMKLGELFSQLNKSDKNTQLLLALKPHLRPENQSKVDGALKLLKIMNILPLLKDSGIIDNLF